MEVKGVNKKKEFERLNNCKIVETETVTGYFFNETGKRELDEGSPNFSKSKPAQKNKGLKIIDGSPSSISKWLREQENNEVEK